MPHHSYRDRWMHSTISAIIAVMGFGASSLISAAPRPNVVVILADDMGWGDLGVNGNTDVATPHIDSLARDGISLERFYVCPVCSPTRAEFLTGRYHPCSGVCDTSKGGERMNAAEHTIADAFKAAGYATACFGKWHSGANFPYHPNARGFEEFYGFCSGHWGEYLAPQLEHNGSIVKGNGFVADDFTNRANDCIAHQHAAGKPFFLFLAFNTPHSPMQVPDPYWEKFRNKEITQKVPQPKRKGIDHTRAALALCENIDHNVGKLLAKLDELKIADNTLVLFFSDNGPNGHRWNGGMKGIKGSVDEGGVRSPLFIRWPGGLPKGKRIPAISAAIDLYPTLTALTGLPSPSAKPLDGISLKTLLTDPDHAAENATDRLIFSHWNGKVSARNQRYRLGSDGRLFDMQQDPSQQHDVSTQLPEITHNMKTAVSQWRGSLLPNGWNSQRPFTIAHPAVAWSRLPADDATIHGTIRRSSIHPNCSYLTHWTSPKDEITWDVEVAAAGTYEVTLAYTCPEADLGSTLELSLGKSRISAKVRTAHDPPLLGKEMERVPRTEGYLKDFQPMTLGVMGLEKGRHTLTLRATAIPGRQVLEFRHLTFTRIK